MRSIERTLLAWILGAMAFGTVLVAAATYLLTLEELHEAFDEDLGNIARAMAAYHHAGHGPQGASPASPPERHEVPDESEIVTLTWAPDGTRLFASDPRVQVPFSRTEGIDQVEAGGEAWIVYTVVRNDGVAQAAQRRAARREMAGELAAKLFPPMIGLAVVVGVLLVYGLRRGMQPLDGAARDVARRSVQSLEPIPLAGAPAEIAPLVHSINGLMQRLGDAFGAQRRFLADAAHELRTPVTALRLQLQLLQRSTDAADREQAMAELAGGIDRTQRLVEQLLQVARAEPDAGPPAAADAEVDLADLAQSTVAAFSAKADALGLDLGAQAPQHVHVRGDAAQLAVLAGNLVDNALRYTPPGGVVDVIAERAADGSPLLRVRDTGPGIPAAERGRVFDRFFRGDQAPQRARDGAGSGLGLAIVKSIADRHGAGVRLEDAPDGSPGLVVAVEFPRPPA